MVCSHPATSKPSTNSSHCRLVSSTAFSSMAFDVFYARLYCPLGGSAPNHRAAAPPALRATSLHAVATSARRRPALLTPRPTAGPSPSRSPSPRVSAFRRTPELRPRYGHRVPASRAIALHHNSSCACRCSARRTPASPARAHGPAPFRPPNTCTHHQFPRITARTLTPPARRRPRSALAPPANRSSPVLAHSRVSPGAAGALFHSRACLLRPPLPLWRRSPVHAAPTHTRTARASPAVRAPPVPSRANSLRPRSPAQFTPLARAAPALPR
jgi:hypothetical protein